MASFDQYELGTATKWKNRIRPRLMQAMLNVKAEEVFVNTAFSINRMAHAGQVINNLDDFVGRYSLSIAIDPSIEAAYIAARDAALILDPDLNLAIEAGVDAIADGNIDSEISSLINAFSNITEEDITNSRNIKNLEVKDIASITATLTWEDVSGASSYNTRHRVKGVSVWTAGGPAASEQPLTGLTASTIYEVQVQTVYSGGTSNWSEIIEFTTTA